MYRNVSEMYAAGIRDGFLAVKNSPVAPRSGNYTMFSEPWSAPDDRECRDNARLFADPDYAPARHLLTTNARGMRAYWLGKARGIRGTIWVA